MRTIGLLEEFGFRLTMPHSRQINGELKELRIKAGSDITRLFYFLWRDRIYIITSGYLKKSNKTDPLEIRRALDMIRKFKEEHQ